MTYRRLFRYLVIVSTVLLVLVEWQTMKGASMTQFIYSRSSYFVGIVPGNVILNYLRNHEAATPSEAKSAGFLELFEFPRPDATRMMTHCYQPGDSGWRNIPRLFFGNFRMSSHREGNGVDGDTYQAVFRLEFPLWVPWLVFVTGAFVICRLMEKRTASAKEKKLAERHESDRSPDQPA